MSTPVASMARRAPSLTSGPPPSPAITLILCPPPPPASPYARARTPPRRRPPPPTPQGPAAAGWPEDGAGLPRLPGAGPYTARARLALCRGPGGPPPRDVNPGRVAARAGLGVEPHQAPAARLDEEL